MVGGDDTGQGQVGDPIGATRDFGANVVDVECYAGCPAPGAGPPPLCQQVLSDLEADERAWLILHSSYLIALHLLLVEPDQLLVGSRDRCPPAESGDHRQSGVCWWGRLEASLWAWSGCPSEGVRYLRLRLRRPLRYKERWGIFLCSSHQIDRREYVNPLRQVDTQMETQLMGAVYIT